MLVANQDHLLIEADAAAIEAVLVGYCSGSREYIRLARSGVHGFLTSHIVGSPINHALSDEEFTAACKATKAAHPKVYETAKRIVHLSNYMGTPSRIWDEYEEEFQSLRQVQDLQALYFSLIPDVVKWQRDTCARAAKEKYLQTPFGVRHYFYNVFQWDRRSASYKLGDDAKRCVAFQPQSMAASIQDLVLMQINSIPDLRDRMRLVIHDSLILEVPEWQAEFACKALYRAMVAPIPELAGLSVGCEVKIGPNLADMKEWHQ